MVKAIAFSILLCGIAAWMSCACLCGNKDRAADATVPPPPSKPTLPATGESWQFVVSGDSRNCGDVVMPAIARGADKNHAQFYWHLGDLRAIYRLDEDMTKVVRQTGDNLGITKYQNDAWKDFERNQIEPFGDIPFIVGIGNHETIAPKSRCEFAREFASKLNDPMLQHPPSTAPAPAPCPVPPAAAEDKCPATDDASQPTTYFHWHLTRQVDFIYLDNASACQFTDAQLAWFNKVIDDDLADQNVASIVVGMHEALPESISRDHSMNQSSRGTESGLKVYEKLLEARKKRKVFVLASHSHFYMEDIFNTDYWRDSGRGVLPGWIVGTAGAERYKLPEPNPAPVAKANTYGYLLGTVDGSGAVTFEFKQLERKDIPGYIKNRYTPEFVNWCFEHNRQGDETSAP